MPDHRAQTQSRLCAVCLCRIARGSPVAILGDRAVHPECLDTQAAQRVDVTRTARGPSPDQSGRVIRSTRGLTDARD